MKKFAFGASKFFLGSVFGCVFVLLLFFTQCTYAVQTFLLQISLCFSFGIALFVLFLSLDRLRKGQAFVASADRIARCAHILSIICFYFPYSSIFL